MKGIYRVGLAVCSLLALSGCKDVGLEENTPVEQAQNAPPKLPAIWITPASPGEPEPAAQPVALGGVSWLPVAQWHHVPGSYVRRVDGAAGRPLFAFAWDERPYDLLLEQEAPGRFREYRRVH